MGTRRQLVGASPGLYPDPCEPADRMRGWDGEVWTDTVVPVVGDEAHVPPRWKRRPFAFVGNRPFQVWLASALFAAAALWGYASTGQVTLFAVSVLLGALGTPLAFLLFVRTRIRFDQVVGWWSLGIIAAAGAGSDGLAYSIEGCIYRLPHGSFVELLLVGPVEESCKLLVPLVLYAFGRFRDPRAGLAVVLASAAGFAIAETGQSEIELYRHAVSGLVEAEVTRMFASVLHMTLTGLIGAVAWRTWRLRGRCVLTWGVAGAAVFSMALHSINDLISAARGPWGLLSLAIVAVSYVAFKLAARELTPPDAIALVPPGWRPTRLATVPAAGGEMGAAEAAATVM